MDDKKNLTTHSRLMIQLLFILQIVVSVALVIALGVIAPLSLVVTIPAIAISDGAIFWLLFKMYKKQREMLYRISSELQKSMQDPLYLFPIPVIACSKEGTILWYNDIFEKDVAKKVDLIGTSFSQLSTEPMDDFCNRTGVQISYQGRYYHVHAICIPEEECYIFYFEDNTSLIQIAQEYKLSRPTAILVMLDNYDELLDGKKESTKSALLGAVDRELERFIGESTGLLQRLGHDRFLIILEQRHLDQLIADRFPILDSVRKISQDERNPITLSIGVGSTAETLGESEVLARQALDMALGRGGDQAAVKTATGYDFYGGVSKGIEKRTRVKSRVVATALREMIDQSDKVIVMGHRFGDLDCIGAAIGMTRAIQKLEKPCYLAVEANKTLAVGLLDRAKEAGLAEMLVHPDDALEMMTNHTLLIIIDTHNPDFVEAPGLYQRAKNVVVIDHHRKMVRYIDDAVIFYHEPYSSSASEMVTELIQYLGDYRLGKFEAEALLAGIMLDTKNFVIKVGVRTFEAAAYLKGLGADTVSVRRLFADTIETYQQKTKIVSSAETYRNCAIAICDFQSDDVRIIAPQAADELLNISGVSASFVIYMTNTTANISARSLGEWNAQVIMETLGGGGHQTMAAAQLEDTDIEKAKQLLLEAIDAYCNPVAEGEKSKEANK